MDVLGISAFHRDAAAALVRDGIPIAAAAEERFSRVRHDAAFPRRAIRFCLGQGAIDARALDAVVFHEKPSRRFERLLAGELAAFPRSWRTFPKVVFPWLGDRLWMRGRIVDELGVDPQKVLFVGNHEAKAANAYFTSPAAEAAVLVADEAGEWATTTLARGAGNALEVLAEIEHPHSLALLVSAVADHLGLGGDDGQSRVLALAAHGEPRFREALASVLALESDGSFTIDLSRLESALGERRAGGAPLLWQGSDRRHADVAASLAVALGDALLGLARELHRRVPSENLCFGGSLASSPELNARLLAQGPFPRLYVPPAPGDAGAALGAALQGCHLLGKFPRAALEHAFLGEDARAEGAEGGLRIEDRAALVEWVAQALAQGQLVGWVQGRFEWGARALGHRSLLADPRSDAVAERLSSSVKRREAFLPLACSVPAERAAGLFDLADGGAWPARFAQMSATARNGSGASLPAAFDAGRRARPQLVDVRADPLFHALLSRFGEIAGAPVLLNTSLNLRGEPIARGEADALGILRKSRLDRLVVEDRVYERT
jgi:carbamoyltransferase